MTLRLVPWPRFTELGSIYKPAPQAATELLVVLSRSRPAFERMMADQLICRRLVNASYAGLFMASPVGYGVALEWWDVAHRHRPGLLVEH